MKSLIIYCLIMTFFVVLPFTALVPPMTPENQVSTAAIISQQEGQVVSVSTRLGKMEFIGASMETALQN